MIRRPTTRRPAATLLEVLIGFGILGVAATSIMALFPFSALTVSQAMKDDRTTTAAQAGDAMFRDWHRRYVVEPGESKTGEPYHRMMDNTGFAGRPPLDPLLERGPSYPVYLDPMGIAANRGDVAGVGLIQRTTAQAILEQPATQHQLLSLRYCSLMDGLKFNEDGVVTSAYDMRELRYNFAWMLQRPSNRDRYTVRAQIVVYDRRAHLYAPPGSETAL